MINWMILKWEWFCNIKEDLLVGVVVGLVFIFEAIVFFIIVGVDFKVGFYVFFIIVVLMVFFGGRLGFIFVVIGVMVLLMVDLVKDYGL